MLSLAPLVLSPNSRGPKPLLLTCQRSFTQRCFYLYPGYRAPSAEQEVTVETSTWRKANNDCAPHEAVDTPLPYG